MACWNAMEAVGSRSRWHIRPPTAVDRARMAGLAGQLGYPCGEQEVSSRLAAMQGSNDYAVFVAERSGDPAIAGWIGLYIFRSVETPAFAEISGLVVDETLRSVGAGAALLLRAEEWARGRGCEALAVRTNVLRERAHRFYRKHGFILSKTQAAFSKTLPAATALSGGSLP